MWHGMRHAMRNKSSKRFVLSALCYYVVIKTVCKHLKRPTSVTRHNFILNGHVSNFWRQLIIMAGKVSYCCITITSDGTVYLTKTFLTIFHTIAIHSSHQILPCYNRLDRKVSHMGYGIVCVDCDVSGQYSYGHTVIKWKSALSLQFPTVINSATHCYSAIFYHHQCYHVVVGIIAAQLSTVQNDTWIRCNRLTLKQFLCSSLWESLVIFEYQISTPSKSFWNKSYAEKLIISKSISLYTHTVETYGGVEGH
jgi:hypothetical protein